MQTLQQASFRNSYLYQIQIILADKENPPEASAFLLGKTRFDDYYKIAVRDHVPIPKFWRT